ncbi:MAG: hypothetical protein ABGY11_03315 [Candidatus Thioglobus sp.]
MLSAMLKLLFVILISMQSLVAYGDTIRKSPGKFLSFDPELELLDSKYVSVLVLKGSDEPYTGLVSTTSSIWKDVVIKESFVNGYQSLGTRMYYSKSTGEKLNGEFKTYYPDGAKYGVISLINGKQDGLTTSWHPNGKLKLTRNYSVGVEDGEYKLYYENGNKKQTGVSSPDGSTQWTDWNVNGYKESFYNFKYKDKPPASSKHWDSEGRKHGSWVDRYDDGSMYKQKQYIHGNPEGIWTTWHDNGNRHTSAYFKRGLLHGAFNYWNKEGVSLVSGHFRNSKETGQWVFKDNDGSPIQRPDNFHVDITDGDDPIEIVDQNNKMKNMMDLYISIQIPLAIALLVLLPLLGVGMCWLYRRLRDKKRNNQGVNV